MGMKYYGILTGLKLDIERPTPYVEKKPGKSKMFLMPTAKDITLAEYNASSSDAITAHRLSDYRRRRFSLTLLPDFHIILEDLLSSVEGKTVSVWVQGSD